MESERCVAVLAASADSQRRMNKLVLQDGRAGASRELMFKTVMDKEYIQRYGRKRYSKRNIETNRQS